MIDYLFEKFKCPPVPHAQLKKSIEIYVGEQLEFYHDLSFAENFPYRELNLPKEFFLQKVIVCNGQQYLTGPRFLARDITKPFVELIAGTAPLVEEAYHAIIEHWSELNTQLVRSIEPGPCADSHIDQYIYGATLKSMCTRSKNENSFSVRLRRATRDHAPFCYEKMQHAYQETYFSLPELKQCLQPSDKEDLLEAAENGELWLIMEGDSVVGFFTIKYGQLAFIEQWWVIDEVIFKQFRGCRLAAQAQLALAHELARLDPEASLCGTITPKNLPSRKTAELAGRSVVAAYVFWGPQSFKSTSYQRVAE